MYENNASANKEIYTQIEKMPSNVESSNLNGGGNFDNQNMDMSDDAGGFHQEVLKNNPKEIST
jgi:hypothetical protein